MIEKTIAIIGAGYWGKNLVRNFHELGVLKTVCDGDPNCRKKTQDSYPGIDVTGDFDAVLEKMGTESFLSKGKKVSVPTFFTQHSALSPQHLFFLAKR